MYRFCFILLTTLWFALVANAQDNTNLDNENTPAETTKGENDSIQVVIKSWHLAKGQIEPFTLDTLLAQFQNYKPAYRNDITATFQGNQGLAYQSNNFFAREQKSGFYFYKNYENYVILPSTFRYFNTTVPYTQLNYSQSENKNTQSEVRFNVLHTQNVTDKLNFVFDYYIQNSQGQYINQETRDYSINLGTNYLGQQYVAHTNFSINKLSTQENGGLAIDDLINGSTPTNELPFKIHSGAKSKLRHSTFEYDHLYKLGKKTTNDEDEEEFIPRISFQHYFAFTSNNRRYYDDTPKRKYDNQSLYPNVYRNEEFTADTTKFQHLNNRFQINAYEAPDRKFTFGKSAYIESEQIWLTLPADQLGTFIKKNYNNTYVGGKIYRSSSKFLNWNAQGKFAITGYKVGDFDLKGTLEKPVKMLGDTAAFTGTVRIRNTKADYFQNFYRSNHYQWNNDFDFTQRIDATFNFEFGQQLTMGANYTMLSNYIYHNQNALPQQANNDFSIIGLYLNTNWNAGPLNIRAKLLYQELTDDTYLHLPRFTAYVSTYMKFKLAKVLHTQLGVDTRYFTKFYADAFDPATAMFHLQKETKIGNYPVFDLFANLKLKRTRAFFILQNAASGIIGKNQFSAPHYPINKRTFRLGISWTFYD